MMRNSPFKTGMIVALATLFTASGIAHAAKSTIKSYDLPASSDGKTKAKVKLAVPKDWEDPLGYYGLPLMLIANEEEDFKPSLSVTPTDMSVKFDEKALKKDEGQYKAGRENFLQKIGGKFVSADAYRTEKWDGIEVAHVVGHRFKVQDREFAEKSYYVTCKGKLYHLKSLMLTSQEKEIGPVMADTVKSFGCGEGK